MQGALLLAKLFINSYPGFLTLATLLGVSTALVYPTFLMVIAEYALTPQRGHLPPLARRCLLCRGRAAHGYSDRLTGTIGGIGGHWRAHGTVGFGYPAAYCPSVADERPVPARNGVRPALLPGRRLFLASLG